MTKEDKYLDEMLEKLDGYKPSVEPDWDAFYQKNKGRIPAKKSNGIVSTTYFRLSLIVVAILAIFAGGYYYMQPSSTMEENIEYEQNTIVPAKGNETIDERQIEYPAATEIEQQIETIPEHVSPVENSNAGGVEAIINDPGAVPGQTVISGYIPEVGLTIINESNTETAITPKDSATYKPVIIKKTIIVKDTIHVTKPIKKNN